MAQGRSLWGQVLINFLNSIKFRKNWELVGKDYMGTEYYEAVSLKKNRSSRCFVPENPNNVEQEIPPEWDAWLRHRRKEPPTEEEIQLNIQKMLTRIENARRLEQKQSMKLRETINNNKAKFPAYEDYNAKTGFSKQN